MTTHKKILILTAPFGSGHLQVSNALVKEFNKHENIIVEEYDLYSEEFPILSKTIQKAYLNTYKPIGKDIYRMLYYGSNHIGHDTIYAKLLKPTLEFGANSLQKKIKTFNPDLIIDVFPVTSLYKLQKKNFNIPVYTVITDYYANGLWLYNEAVRHYISTHRITAWGVANGLKASQFKLTGIPIHEKFYQKLDKDLIYEKYKLNKEKRNVLIAAGAHGVLPRVADITTTLLELSEFQVIVVCGKNEQLFNELKQIQVNHKNLFLIGFTNEMHELLEIADLMITKPGGISLTEAAIKTVPVLLYNPVYGQELENAKYFSEKQAGVIVSNKTDLIYHLVVILSEEEVLEKMKNNMRKIAQEFSARQIVEDILKDGEY